MFHSTGINWPALPILCIENSLTGVWLPGLMVPDLEKPRVTELQLRMDCNGCVQKIKKALHNVDGVYEIYIDSAQQKLTVVGRAELDQILRAIKKTRKIATICSHTDPNAPPPAEQPADGQPPPAPEAAAAPPTAESPPAKPEEPPKDPPQPPQEGQAAEAKPPEPKVVEEVPMVHHYPYRYVYNRQLEAPRYVHQWGPAPRYRYGWMDDEDYYHCRQREDGDKVTCLFSEENSNNCTIM